MRRELRQYDPINMSQRVHRTLVLCAALVGCDTPAAEPSPAPSPAPVVADEAPKPAPVEPASPPAPEAAPKSSPPSAKVTPELKQAIARSINKLTIGLQHKLVKQPGNVLVSSVSVSVALAMLHAGSDGATAKELADVLHVDASAADIAAGFAGLAARWTHASDSSTFLTASRLFGAQSIDFKPDYLALTRSRFGEPLEPLDFAGDPAGARDRINGWVREQTDGRIAEVMPEGSVDAATRLVLADAAYFKADWLEPFDPAATTEQMFYGAQHKRMVPMMHSVQRLRLAFGLAGKVRILDLPYKGGDYSMIIVLPSKRDGLKDSERHYDADRLEGWLEAAKVIAIELKLPRFSLDSDLDLAPALQKLGAARVFDPKRADLGGMADDKKLALNSLRHRAQISVEERGAEAAPAIAVAVGDAPTAPIPFIVDRPFMFYIRDNRSGVLLFYGRVTDL